MRTPKEGWRSVSLSDEDLVRYNRQILFADFGEEGQRRLRQAHVFIAGVGGLGSPVAIYLACAGVGCLTLADCESVELSNLNRQILHWEEDIQKSKVISAARKLREMNSTVEIVSLPVRITDENVQRLVGGVDVVIDCMDNMATRFVLNEACVRGGIPLIHGGVQGLMGEVTTIVPGQTPCFECIFPRGAARQESFPIFGPTAALVASLQSMEAIKLLASMGTLLAGRMLYTNGKEMEFMFVEIEKKRDCQVCGGGDQ